MTVSFNIHLTDDCNFDCDICFETKAKPAKYLYKDKLLAFIDDLKPGHVGFVGGEPLCHPEINSILSCLKDRAIHTCLVTNGEQLDKLTVLPDRLSIGIDHADQTNVDNFLSTNPNCAIEITITPTEITKIDALIQKYEQYIINISMLAFWNKNTKVLDYVTPEYIEKIKELSLNYKMFGERTPENIQNFYDGEIEGEYACVAPLNIYADGHLAYCDINYFPILFDDGNPMTYEVYNKDLILKNQQPDWAYNSPCKECNLRRKLS